ncbi:hypothetical protein EBN03_28020 [Nocardia stercoris]|uniref:Uncharacterized protein n=1 Tax=Nocardia stercoris TaxID=2483361 RepID=A0A3M2KVF5_9NOCA|nr:hypothetical protein EBN03_28020 [Nocardia stercoris]
MATLAGLAILVASSVLSLQKPEGYREPPESKLEWHNDLVQVSGAHAFIYGRDGAPSDIADGMDVIPTPVTLVYVLAFAPDNLHDGGNQVVHFLTTTDRIVAGPTPFHQQFAELIADANVSGYMICPRPNRLADCSPWQQVGG